MVLCRIYLLVLLFVVLVQRGQALTCSTRLQIEHGYIDFKKIDEAKGKVPVVCETGYKAKPDKEISCLVDGSWEGVECKPQDCKKEKQVKNADPIDFNKGTTYPVMLDVKCKSGFKVKGHPYLMCLETGKWSDNTTCERADCGGFHNITNGYVEFKGKSTTYPVQYDAKCNHGYELRGDKKVTCQANGKWSRSTACLPIDCGTDVYLKNGYALFDGKTTTFKSKVQVKCGKGYKLSGPDYITCNENGTWSNDTKCNIEHCSTVDSVPNGDLNLTGRNTEYRAVVPVDCHRGYQSKGEPYVICQAGGDWTKTICVLKDCGTKFKIENGIIDYNGKSTQYKADIPVKCKDGYVIRGDPVINCQSNGKWSDKTLCVEAICPTVYRIDNGWVDFAGRSTTYKSKIPVVCNEGFATDGKSEIECLKNGKWSNKTCYFGPFGRYTTLIFSVLGGVAFIIIVGIIMIVLKCKKKLCFA